jgi:predicted ester cyclase
MITSPELFLNCKSVPDKSSSEYEAFFQNELKKIEYGVTINGVFIPGWLYWHINHWHMYMDYEDPINHSIKRINSHPKLRDNEWMIAEYLLKAEQEKKGLLIVGSRRLGKSEFEGSMVGRNATIYQGTQNIITGGNEPDIRVISSIVDNGLKHLHPYFRFDRIANDWRKEVVLGYKDKKNIGYEWSKILIRNFDDGNNTEAAAGTTAKTFIMDEIGKFPFFECFEAARPAFTSPYGWRCVPILTGTGGSFDRGGDAEEMFNNPGAYNFYAVEVEGESKKFGLFIPGTYRMEGKQPQSLSEYAKVPSGSELDDVTILVKDEVRALQIINEERDSAKRSNDSRALLKQMMYYPLTPAECFLSEGGNDFPIEAAKQHLQFLNDNEIRGQYITLYRDSDGKVRHKFAEDKQRPITDFPVKSTTLKDAPIVVWEFPITNAPMGLYVAGADPYNQSSSQWSDSLGTVIVYKRMTDVVGETYHDMPVASYAARPNTMNEWHDNVEMLMDFYNARCFPENEAGTFIQYFERKNKGHMLAEGFNIAREINPNTKTAGRIYGLAATQKNIDFCMSLFIEYCKEEIQIGTNKETGEPIKKLGVTRILDTMLLEEIIKYNKDGNFDRIVAFRHALAYAKHLDKYFPINRVEEKLRPENYQAPKANPMMSSPFIGTPNSFKRVGSIFQKTNNMFGI